MKELKLNFETRLVNMVSDQKTVIAYMDNKLNKSDFLSFFPDKATFDTSVQVSFDFEKGLIAFKQAYNTSLSTGNVKDRYDCIKKIAMPSLNKERHKLLKAVGWEEA